MGNVDVWNNIYKAGHEQKAPWDSVVSFVYRNKPVNTDSSQISLLEVGCGTASNLRFFAQQGFNVSGIDFSADAIECAKSYFHEHSLKANLSVGSFEKLDYADGTFDLAFDRAALTCAGISVQRQAISEICRVLKPGGRFLYTPYADTHSSCLTADKDDDGLSYNIKNGNLQGVGSICFVTRKNIESFFPSDQWTIVSMEYETQENVMENSADSMHSSWRVIVEKK